MNNKTQVVGGSADANSNVRAFLWENGVMTDLNTLVQPNSGLYLVYAGDINDAGEITGQAVDNAGTAVGFVAVPDLQQPFSPVVAENNASANIIFPEGVQGLFRPRGILGSRLHSNQLALKNLDTMGDAGTIAECRSGTDSSIVDQRRPDNDDGDHFQGHGHCQVNTSTHRLTGNCIVNYGFACGGGFKPQQCPVGARPINLGSFLCAGHLFPGVDTARSCTVP